MKIKDDAKFLEELTDQVEDIISNYGDCGGFSCDEWTKKWISGKVPAINAIPGDLESTKENQELLINILGRTAHGVFS